MQMPVKSEENKEHQNMEERLSKVGAKIDDLIVKADEARNQVKFKLDEAKAKKEATLKKSEAALDELKAALDRAWTDLNDAWEDIKEGTERAAEKFRSE